MTDLSCEATRALAAAKRELAGRIARKYKWPKAVNSAEAAGKTVQEVRCLGYHTRWYVFFTDGTFFCLRPVFCTPDGDVTWDECEPYPDEYVQDMAKMECSQGREATAEYDAEAKRLATEARTREERREYERLRAKFEGGEADG